MHIQKLLAMISVGAILSAASLQAQSADNDTQAKAREAMRQYMARLNSQQTPTNTPAPVVPKTPVPAVPPPVAPSSAPVYPTTPQPPAAPDVAPVVPATPVAPVVPESPKAETKEFEHTGTLSPAATVQTPAPVVAPGTQTWPPQTASPELQAQALEALRQKKAELDATQPIAPVSVVPVVKGSTTPVAAPMTSQPVYPTPLAPVAARSSAVIASQPILQPVPLPATLTGTKEQKLMDLLQLYKSDRITPTEYHQQRAKILSEP